MAHSYSNMFKDESHFLSFNVILTAALSYKLCFMLLFVFFVFLTRHSEQFGSVNFG